MDVTSNTNVAGNMLSGVVGTKNDGTSVTGSIATKTSSDLTASGATVTAPAGYYSADASKSVTTMTLPTTTSTSATSGYTLKATLDRSTSDRYLNIAPGYNSAGGYYKINKVANGSVTAPSSISGTSATVSTGTNTLTLTKTVSVTPSVTTAGYVSSGTAGNSSVSLTASVTTKAAATITPSTSAQEIAAGTYLTGKQTISAMPSGTAGTPTASKGTVSNHAISVTPSVTNTTGYITGGTKTGTAVSVSASELVSGTYSVTSSGTKDVTNYASASVPEGQVGYPTATKGTVSNHSISVTPKVNISDSGYVDAGVLQGTAVSVSASELVSGTIYADRSGSWDVTNVETLYIQEALPTAVASKGSVSNHAVSVTPSVQTTLNDIGWLGVGTINGTAVSVSASELVSGTKSITENGTSIDVTNYASVDVAVPTGARNFVQGTFTTSSTTGAAQTITVPYEGNGYPLLVYVELTEGLEVAYNSGRYKAIGAWFASKFDKDSAAGYNYDYATVFSITGANYTEATKNEYNYQTYYSARSGASGNEMSDTIALMSATQFSVWVSEARSYGLMPGTSYTYYIVYSE